LNTRATRLLNLLQIEKVDENLFRAENEPENGKRIFGGQVIAQALIAASRTLDGYKMHSCHAYFLRPGDNKKPVLLDVERVRDGRSFSMRRVVAIQNGQAIFNMDVSFHIDESGFEHSEPMPNVPTPQELRPDDEVAKALDGSDSDPRLSPMAKLERPFEMRSVFEIGSAEWAENRSWSPVWVRYRGELNLSMADTPNISAALLAYASDMGLVSTGFLPHQTITNRSKLQMASLDHSLWIYRDIPITKWLLFHKRTTTAANSRALVHADFFSEEGVLIATTTQEGLLRAGEAS